MALKLKLTSLDLLNKQFKGVVRGYDPLEVDSFIDRIIKDYETVEQNFLSSKEEIDSLKDELKANKETIRSLELVISRYETRLSHIKESDNVTSDNIDYIKRIRKLENYIWKSCHINPDTIK